MATKPPAKPAAPAAKEEAPAAAPPKSKKMLIIGIVVLLLAVGGGAAWFFTKGDAAADAHAAEKKVEPAHEAKYIPLGENFTVNLQREEGDQYLQAGISLKILQPELEEKIKTAMPEIRSKMLFLLSSKLPSELQTVEGKKQLIAEIIAEVDAVLGLGSAPVHAAAHEPASAVEAASAPVVPQAVEPKTKGVVDVLFTSFIIQ
ncbi:MAG: flagellar basal body-associated FliL family protein [Sideroxyarcus sp.]|nr:flagellar basal body-associated FliL family protein [Sideroxyarcus sp.]